MKVSCKSEFGMVWERRRRRRKDDIAEGEHAHEEMR
jgi:hypothetical protein